MKSNKYQLITSTDEADKKALVLIDGAVAAQVDRQRVAVSPEQMASALSNATINLAMAVALHKSGEQREGFK